MLLEISPIKSLLLKKTTNKTKQKIKQKQKNKTKN